MYILSTTLPNLSISDVMFPALLSNLFRSWFQKYATLMILIDLSLFFWWRSLRYPVLKLILSLTNVGSGVQVWQRHMFGSG